MRDLKQIFGYPVTITDLQENDILYFTGEAWINKPISAEYIILPLATPDTTDNRDSAVFSLDSIPIRKLLATFNQGGIALVMQGITSTWTGGSQVEPVFSNMYLTRNPEELPIPSIGFTIT